MSKPFSEAAVLDPQDLFSRHRTGASGLKETEAIHRLEETGMNELEGRKVTALTVALRQFKSPLVYLLLVAAAVSAALGETVDALTIAAILLVDAGIGFWQEYHSEQALRKLSEHLGATARVRRGGVVLRLSRRELVPGDVVLLEPGDIAPADLRLFEAENLTVDESVLTGESINVGKDASRMAAAPSEPFQARNAVFMMSRIVSGYGEGVVIATGRTTVMGSVAALTEETERVSSFEKNIAALSGFLIKSVAVTLAVVFSANIFLKGTDSLVPQLLFAVALAVSVIPEALPAIAAITLSKGALALSKRHVIVKRLSGVEDLGHIQILCTDKTGTITEGVMAVRSVSCQDAESCIALGLAASSEDEFAGLDRPKTFGGAMMVHADEKSLARYRGMRRRWFSPFDPNRRRTSAVVEERGGRTLVSMGAPEEILARSTCDEAGRMKALADASAAGTRGWRVLAIGTRDVPDRAAYGEKDVEALMYRGFIAFADPLKATAKKALHDAARLSVEVKIVTGDSPEVAGAIAKELGLIADAALVLTGDRLDALGDLELQEAVQTHRVFARISPERKYRIIQALQARSLVGFLGEGINDAPALKLANVSLVVQSASDVAREAADIILLRKDLHVIIDGIREGRAIFTNIVKYVKYTLIGNLGNFIAIAGISLLIDYLPMLPVQILLTNLLTDLPLVAVSGDRVDEDELRTPRTFNIRELAFVALFLGLVSSTFDFVFFAVFRPMGPGTVQTMWFVFGVLTELALIYSIRTRGPFWKAVRPGWVLIGATALSVVLAVGIPFTGFGAEAFRFLRPSATGLATVVALAAAYFIVTETVKLKYVRSFKMVPKT